MSAKDAKNLELAIRELTAEMKRQRGVDPDASITDKPRRLTEVDEYEPRLGRPSVGDMLAEGCEYVIPKSVTTGYGSRAMEILRKQLEENDGNA